jgi:hypothetical protein
MAAALAATVLACASTMEQTEGMSTAGVPPEQRADYAIFAQRCSKCHSLARPLNSGITDDGFWRMYVAKMRHQPASGITEGDTAPILRFLHWYSVDRDRPKLDAGEEATAPAPAEHSAKSIDKADPADGG